MLVEKRRVFVGLIRGYRARVGRIKAVKGESIGCQSKG